MPRSDSDGERGGAGSAALVGTGVVPFALANDAGGSIRLPAAFCGTVGLFPTHERIPVQLGASTPSSCSVNGPIAGTVADAAIVYALMAKAGVGSRAGSGCAGAALHTPVPLLLPLLGGVSSKSLAGLRVGLYRRWAEDAEPSIVACMHVVLDAMKANGTPPPCHTWPPVPLAPAALRLLRTATALPCAARQPPLKPPLKHTTPPTCCRCSRAPCWVAAMLLRRTAHPASTGPL